MGKLIADSLVLDNIFKTGKKDEFKKRANASKTESKDQRQNSITLYTCNTL
jgi:hypothetical protein